jgi:phosphatidylglycerol:prolipoprotein diacylglycerol transferase
MLAWDVRPEIVTIGPIAIRWYGLFYALGFLLGYYVLRKAAREKRIANLTQKLADDYIFLLIMAGVLGGRLFYVLVYNPLYYAHNLLEAPAVWHGGMSIHGGLLAGICMTWYFCKKHKINFYEVADALVAPFALAIVFVRIANYLNGELWGTVTSVPWCVLFPGADGCRHPSQLYEAAYSLALFAILTAAGWRDRLATGVRFWAFIGLYGALRFLVTFYRELDPQDPGLLGLGIGQWLSLLMVLAAVWWLAQTRRTGHPLTKKSS